MNKEGKNFKIIGLRPSKGGDIITSLPVLNLLEQQYPGSYKTVSIAKKNSVFAPLLFNHSLIDHIHINEILEKPNKEDIDFFNSHDLIIPPNLKHPDPFWYNKISMVEENFKMMGFDWSELEPELRIPKLAKWFDIIPYGKTIAIWPMAGNGADIKRSPTKEWYNDLINKIFENLPNYKIFIFGHPNDFDLGIHPRQFGEINNFNKLDFLEQIKMTLGCSLTINTDSGSGLVIGAYGTPQITLLTDWQENHISNFDALAPMNKNNISLFAHKSCDYIKHEDVLNAIKQII